MIRSCWFAFPLVLSITMPVIAQENRRGSDRARGGFRGDGQIPSVGSMLPSLKVVDEQGTSFSTDTLRDSYTVLVFGCLT